jgi:hypothetical protein
VGGERRPLVVSVAGHLFVGPDNGLFWPLLDEYGKGEIVHLKESRFFLESVSRTFHGRDIFAPVAAHLALGVAPKEMGVAIEDPIPLPIPKAKENEKGVLTGQIIRIDRFGNIITSIHTKDLKAFLGTDTPIIQAGPFIIEGLNATYSDVSKGERLALMGSSGYLEISVNMGSASAQLGREKKELLGEEVKVFRKMKASPGIRS